MLHSSQFCNRSSSPCVAVPTWMLHVSSVSNSTIGSPPLAISTLFCGRNRATTAQLHHQHNNLK